MPVYILFRFSKRTGKIDTTMTGITSAMMQLWALNNTTKTKASLIVERATGTVIFTADGTGDFPKVKKGNLGSITEYGISLDDLQSIKDERFD